MYVLKKYTNPNRRQKQDNNLGQSGWHDLPDNCMDVYDVRKAHN